MEHEILSCRVRANELFERSMLLVETVRALDREPGVQDCLPKSFPYLPGRIHEHQQHPMPRAKDPEAFLKALRHQSLIVVDGFTLRATHDCFVSRISEDAQPRLPEQVHLGVVDICAKRRVCEDQ